MIGIVQWERDKHVRCGGCKTMNDLHRIYGDFGGFSDFTWNSDFHHFHCNFIMEISLEFDFVDCNAGIPHTTPYSTAFKVSTAPSETLIFETRDGMRYPLEGSLVAGKASDAKLKVGDVMLDLRIWTDWLT